MRVEAPVTLEAMWLNDWTYWSGLKAWQLAFLHVEAGWPPTLIVKVLGLGVRVEVRAG